MTGHTVAILGFSGAMGRWFGKYFAAKGWNVVGCTRDVAKASQLSETLDHARQVGSIEVTADLDRCIPEAEWVMLSIPIPAHQEVIARVAPLMRADAVLLDIASVKAGIPGMLREARREHGIHVLSTHPMFGPGAECMQHKNFILMNMEGDRTALEAFKSIIAPDGPAIIETTPEEHDRMVATTLGLPHFLNILFGTMLKGQGLPLSQVEGFGGTTFHLQHLIAQEVCSQDPSIYAAIQMENEHFINMLDVLLGETSKLVQTVREKNQDDFIGRFKAINEFLSGARGFPSVMERFNAAASRSLEMLDGRRDRATREP